MSEGDPPLPFTASPIRRRLPSAVRSLQEKVLTVIPSQQGRGGVHDSYHTFFSLQRL